VQRVGVMLLTTLFVLAGAVGAVVLVVEIRAALKERQRERDLDRRG
jgi:hypothetical protein